MSRSFKSLILGSCLFASLFSVGYNQLEASSGRWGAYDNGRAAWGGNGGWWGGGRTDFYGDNNYYSNGYYGNGYDDNAGYIYDNNHPYGQHYYAEPNAHGASAGVDGSGFYFNVR
ncbi:MAG: hypothetical protein ACH350_03660 [Parachlamydiaceae bacterium]